MAGRPARFQQSDRFGGYNKKATSPTATAPNVITFIVAALPVAAFGEAVMVVFKVLGQVLLLPPPPPPRTLTSIQS